MQGLRLVLACAGAWLLSDCGGKSLDEGVRREQPEAGAAGQSEGGAAGAHECAGCAGNDGAGAGGNPSAGAVSGAAATAGGNGTEAGRDAGGAASTGASGRAGDGASGDGASGDGTSGDGTSGDGASGEGPDVPDAHIALTSVHAYQAVEIPLMREGATVSVRSAPLVAGRALLVRAFVTPEAEFEPRELVAELSLSNDNVTSLFEAQLTVNAASTAADLASTFTFQVPKEAVTEDSRWSLSVTEQNGDVIATYPAGAAEPLGASAASGELDVTMVPLVANGFTPDLTPVTLELYLSLMRAMFPVAGVNAIVREPVTLDFPVTAAGAGFDQALDRLYEVRELDAPANNVYYYGVLTPAATFDEYCANGCTVGLASVATANQIYYRGGIGTGFFDNAKDKNSPETMAHELGHAMGRRHSPCDTGDASYFPHENGLIGVWGYDGVQLKSPNRFADVMGYCLPVWISDFTYDELFARIAHVNGTVSARRLGVGATRWVRRLIVGHDGSLRWGSESVLADPESVATLELELVTGSGASVEPLRVPFSPFDHLPGGFALVPLDLLAPGVSVRVGTETIDAP